MFGWRRNIMEASKPYMRLYNWGIDKKKVDNTLVVNCKKQFLQKTESIHKILDKVMENGFTTNTEKSEFLMKPKLLKDKHEMEIIFREFDIASFRFKKDYLKHNERCLDWDTQHEDHVDLLREATMNAAHLYLSSIGVYDMHNIRHEFHTEPDGQIQIDIWTGSIHDSVKYSIRIDVPWEATIDHRIMETVVHKELKKVNEKLTQVKGIITHETLLTCTTPMVIPGSGSCDSVFCVICQDDISCKSSTLEDTSTTQRVTDGVTINDCQHSFHENCLLKYLRSDSRCPICRTHLW